MQASVVEGLLRCNHRVLGIGVHFAGFFAVHMVFWVEPFDLGRKLRAEFGSVKTGNGSRTAAALHQTTPIILYGITQRRKGP